MNLYLPEYSVNINDREALEKALTELLQHPDTGKKLQELLDAKARTEAKALKTSATESAPSETPLDEPKSV